MSSVGVCVGERLRNKNPEQRIMSKVRDVLFHFILILILNRCVGNYFIIATEQKSNKAFAKHHLLSTENVVQKMRSRWSLR